VKGIRKRRFRKIRIPPLCDEYPFWVPYISLKGGKGREYITYCIRNGISKLEFLGEPSLRK